MSHSNVVKTRFLSAARCSRHQFYHQIPQAHHRPDFPAAPIRATMPRHDRRGIGMACRTRSMRRIFSKPIRNAAAAALLWAASSPGAFATGTEPATDPQVDPAPCVAAAAADDADRIIAICGELVDNEKTVKADRVKALIARAGAYDRKDMIDRAIGDYDTALRLDPSLADIFNARGELWRRKGDRLHALQDFGAAIKLNPQHEAARANYKSLALELERLGAQMALKNRPVAPMKSSVPLK
jgi:tetratricopeptide (TPR) repeat protein